MTYKLTEDKVKSDYFTRTISEYYEKSLTLYEIIGEKIRLSEEMIENYIELFDEYSDDEKMIKSIDLLYTDEKFNLNELRFISAIVFEIITTFSMVLDTEDYIVRTNLVTKAITLINGAKLEKYKKFIYGY
jgi:hypothetical protein|nr:MAG TPA: hypothetical protein [Caudoviricetes sp.]